MVDKYLPLIYVRTEHGLLDIIFLFSEKGVKILNEIGSMLKEARINAGISIKEASDDLDIKDVELANIEDGSIGAFKDVFALKDYLSNYAKYLGLDEGKILDQFNEYLFEYTSKIPVKDIEKELKELKKEEPKVASPYTLGPRKHKKSFYIAMYSCIIIIVLLVMIWSIKIITVNNHVTHEISYKK